MVQHLSNIHSHSSFVVFTILCIDALIFCGGTYPTSWFIITEYAFWNILINTILLANLISMNSTSAFALASIFLYASLAVTCLYYALTFYDFKTAEFTGGRYSAPKFLFFVVLCLSAVLDIPMYIGCIAMGGPNECEWGSPSYVVFWLFHVIATCGYVYAIITPAVLWSDIIYQRDGNFWNSAYPVDNTKLFFRVTFVFFCLNELTTVIGAVICQNPNDPGNFNDNTIGNITDGLTPILTTLITFGCLWSGIELQRYVMNVGLGGGTRNRVLMQLNLTMFLIAASYMYRSLLVLSLYDAMPQDYKDAMHPIRSSFFLWLLGTRWLPAVVCSFCLVHEMRFKGSANSVSSHSQNAIYRASKDVPGQEPTLYQSLLRAVGVSPSKNSTCGANYNNNNNHQNARLASIESHSTMDSVLEGSYSMLSSVDFPDSSSDTSSAYVLSPLGSPDRPKGSDDQLSLLHQTNNNYNIHNGNHGNANTSNISHISLNTSNSSSNSNNNNNNNYSSSSTARLNRSNVTSKEAERIARKHRKSLQQLGASYTYHNNTVNNTISSSSNGSGSGSGGGGGTHHPPPSHAASGGSTHNTTNNNSSEQGRRHPGEQGSGSGPVPAMMAYSASPQLYSRAESRSSNEADYAAYSPSSHRSIDHFFTFAAPNLNLSSIGNGGDRNNNNNNNSNSNGSSNGPLLPMTTNGRPHAVNHAGPAHIHNTLHSSSNHLHSHSNIIPINHQTHNSTPLQQSHTTNANNAHESASVSVSLSQSLSPARQVAYSPSSYRAVPPELASTANPDPARNKSGESQL